MHELAFSGLARLRQLPPGFLNTLAALEVACFKSLPLTSQTNVVFKRLYGLVRLGAFSVRFTLSNMTIHIPQCSCKDDVTNYKRILRQWVNEQLVGSNLHMLYEPDDTKWPPYSRKYLAMAFNERGIMKQPFEWMYLALCPTTESDVHTRRFLCRYITSVQEHKLLLQKWMTWAASNSIHLDGVGDLPRAVVLEAM